MNQIKQCQSYVKCLSAQFSCVSLCQVCNMLAIVTVCAEYISFEVRPIFVHRIYIYIYMIIICYVINILAVGAFLVYI